MSQGKFSVFFLVIISSIFRTPFSVVGGFNITANNGIQRQRQLHIDVMTDYNPYIMPPLKNGEPILVKISVFIVALVDVNVREQTFLSRAYFLIEWDDQQLQWDPENYAGATKIFIPIEKIWTPDVYIINSFGLDIGLEGVLACVHYSGYVNVYAFYAFQNVFCDINIYNYPFDFQDCAFNFGTWTKTINDITFQVGKPGFDISYFSESGEWHFVTQKIVLANNSFENDTYHSIKFPFRIHRKIIFDLFNNIMPCVLTSLLSVLIFKLPTQSGERISLSITLFLTTAVFLSVVNNSLPRNSDQVSVLEIYLAFQMIITVGAIILTIHSISLKHMDASREVPIYVKFIMKRFGKRPVATCKKDMKKYNVSVKVRNDEIPYSIDRPGDLEPNHIAKTFDRLYFYAYIVFFSVLHIWLLVTGLTNTLFK